jgi:hypothetical protein
MLLSTKLHGVTSQQAVIFTVIPARPVHLIFFYTVTYFFFFVFCWGPFRPEVKKPSHAAHISISCPHKTAWIYNLPPPYIIMSCHLIRYHATLLWCIEGVERRAPQVLDVIELGGQLYISASACCPNTFYIKVKSSYRN